MASSWADRTLTLTTPQRRLLAVLFAIVAVYLGVRLFIDRSHIPDPQPPRGDRWADLADRIDPNSADWTELAALPTLGEKRARAIVAKRDEIRSLNPTKIAFERPEDLYRVTGLGVSMVEQLKPYLRFARRRRDAAGSVRRDFVRVSAVASFRGRTKRHSADGDYGPTCIGVASTGFCTPVGWVRFASLKVASIVARSVGSICIFVPSFTEPRYFPSAVM